MATNFRNLGFSCMVFSSNKKNICHGKKVPKLRFLSHANENWSTVSLYEALVPVCSIYLKSRLFVHVYALNITRLPTMMKTNIWCNHYLMFHLSLADFIKDWVQLVFLVLWQHYYYMMFWNMLTYQQKNKHFYLVCVMKIWVNFSFDIYALLNIFI